MTAEVICWWGIRVPEPGTRHHVCGNLMSIPTGETAGIYCRSPLLVHAFMFSSYGNRDMRNNVVHFQVSL